MVEIKIRSYFKLIGFTCWIVFLGAYDYFSGFIRWKDCTYGIKIRISKHFGNKPHRIKNKHLL